MRFLIELVSLLFSCSALILSFRSCLLFRSCSLVSLLFKIVKCHWFYTGFVKIRVFEKMVFREPFWTDLFSLPLAFWLLLGPLGHLFGRSWDLSGASWGLPGRLLEPLGASWGALGAPLGRHPKKERKMIPKMTDLDRFGLPKGTKNGTKIAPESDQK